MPTYKPTPPTPEELARAQAEMAAAKAGNHGSVWRGLLPAAGMFLGAGAASGLAGGAAGAAGAAGAGAGAGAGIGGGALGGLAAAAPAATASGGHGLLISGLGSLAADIYGKKKASDKANKDAQAQYAYQTAKDSAAVTDQNAANDKNETARLGRFNMAMGILRSLGDAVPASTLDALQASNGKFNPLHQTGVTAPYIKPQSYGFTDFLGDAANTVGNYETQKTQADDYQKMFAQLANNTQGAGMPGMKPPTFGGGSSTFATPSTRPALYTKYKF